MKLWVIFRKTMREMSRDLWVLGLTLAFAPVFVLLYWLWFQGGSTVYRVAVLSHDRGAIQIAGQAVNGPEGAIAAIQEVSYADGKSLLAVVHAQDRSQLEAMLRDREAVAFIEFPADFSQALAQAQAGDPEAGVAVIFGGDLTNPYYAVGSVLALAAVEGYVQEITGQPPLVQYVEQPLGASAARTEFETYVPGVIVLAVILLIFQAAMTVAREIETGALQRLRLTPMTAFDLLGGTTLALALVGAAGVILTFATAVLLGFSSQGPLWVAVLVGALTSLSIIGIGMIIACFTRTVSQAFVVANFPLALMMFFTGAIFPVPQVVLFTFAGRTIGLYDFLPPTHAVVALNKVLTLGAGLADVIFELAALALLSVLYLLAGVIVFQRRQMQA